ncbi:hypothetical protein EMGR_007149 [Emarellia grisea]
MSPPTQTPPATPGLNKRTQGGRSSESVPVYIQTGGQYRCKGQS